jgi:hypothetical protein
VVKQALGWTIERRSQAVERVQMGKQRYTMSLPARYARRPPAEAELPRILKSRFRSFDEVLAAHTITLHSTVVVIPKSKVLFHNLSTADPLPCRQSLLHHFTSTIPHPPSPQNKSKNLQPYTPVSVKQFHSAPISRAPLVHQFAATNAPSSSSLHPCRPEGPYG